MYSNGLSSHEISCGWWIVSVELEGSWMERLLQNEPNLLWRTLELMVLDSLGSS